MSEQNRTVMPPEWAPHERTWMAFPPPNDTFGAAGSTSLDRARTAWSTVARTVSEYEPVTLVAAEDDAPAARDLVGSDVEVVTVPRLDDAWMRDFGPTFVHGQDGAVEAVDWIFNGWGAQEWAAWTHDQHLGRFVAERAGSPVHASSLVNEGGGIHVDGRGTVLLTETVQLDPDRNPGATRQSVEAEVHARLGTTKAIWLPRGLTRDYDGFGTRGHVDIVASFTEAGTLLLHRQDDAEHPDHAVTGELHELLSGAADATGAPLQIVSLPAPATLRDDEGWVDYSYINHYVCNGAVILCAFGDPEADERAAGILGAAYPGRTVELVDAREIFACGGGIHCITQQQPTALDGRG